jgi:hypothetical protein
MNMDNPPPNLKYEGKLIGLQGETFESNGRIAGCIPPMGQKGAIKFKILGEYPGQTPRWADMDVFTAKGEKRHVRINPDICEFPFFRLYDCVSVAGTVPWNEFSLVESGAHTAMCLPPSNGKLFVFTRAFKGKLLLIDTYERMKEFAEGEPIDPKYVNTDVIKQYMLRNFRSLN